ncbi:hypothetical protein, partial [Mitsuokella multacida]|uniref:hypothetical protein n=1 Tax=Mitsuokella multacida TaxID=52226 RepID=UPI003FA22EEF
RKLVNWLPVTYTLHFTLPTCATCVLKIILSLISVTIIMWLPYLLPGLYMKYITDSSVEDIERYLDSSYAMNYLDIGSGIELILILLAIVSTLSLIVRFIRNTTKK